MHCHKEIIYLFLTVKKYKKNDKNNEQKFVRAQ